MTFDEFWEYLKSGGITVEGDKYRIVQDGITEKLHILSPGNANKKYFISKRTAKEYFELLDYENMARDDFQKDHFYFSNVYKDVMENYN